MLVEPPGTAPGSDPRITGAFIAIVPKGQGEYRQFTGLVQLVSALFGFWAIAPRWRASRCLRRGYL